MINKETLEEWRKRNCYCDDIVEPEVCSKCKQELPEYQRKPCINCKLIEDIIKFNKDKDDKKI